MRAGKALYAPGTSGAETKSNRLPRYSPSGLHAATEGEEEEEGEGSATEGGEEFEGEGWYDSDYEASPIKLLEP